MYIYTGQSELYENASSGDTTEDIMFDNINQNPTRSSEQGRPNHAQDKEYYGGLWSNSSRYYKPLVYYLICILLIFFELS